MRLLVLSTSFRSSRCSLVLERTFATKRKPTARPRSVAVPAASNFLQQIILPKTWRGRRALKAAQEFWANDVKKLSGKEPPAGSLEKRPLMLYVDHAPTAITTYIISGKANQIRFTKVHPLGQRLWRIAHPVPWSKRSRWVRWPTFFCLTLYSSLFLFWFLCRVQVPITGRWQFQCLPLISPPPKGTQRTQRRVDLTEEMRSRLLDSNDPRRDRVRKVLVRVLLASGLKHLEWLLLVFDDPGKPWSSCCLLREWLTDK